MVLDEMNLSLTEIIGNPFNAFSAIPEIQNWSWILIWGCIYVSPSKISRIFILDAATEYQKYDYFWLMYVDVQITNLSSVCSKLQIFN